MEQCGKYHTRKKTAFVYCPSLVVSQRRNPSAEMAMPTSCILLEWSARRY